MQFKSNPLLMLRNFLWIAILPTGIAALVLLLVIGIESDTTAFAVLSCIWVLCLCYVIFAGYVRVTVTGDNVVVYTPVNGETVIPRRAHRFSSNVLTHSVNFIPVSTERKLVCHNGAESFEVHLPNIGKGAFNRLVAALRRDAVLAARQEAAPAADTRTAAVAKASFTLPKEAMLAEFRRLIQCFALGGLVLSVGVVCYVQYKVSFASPEMRAHFNIWYLVFFFVLMFVGIGVPVAMEYGKRRRAIPESIAVDEEYLAIGDDRYRLADIRRIVATPPAYGQGDFSNFRMLTVQTDGERKRYNLGVRSPRGIWKTAFAEYEQLCQALESAAVGKGAEFVYDL